MDHFSSSGTSVDDALPCLLVVGPVFPRVTLPVSVSCLGGLLSAHISETQPWWGRHLWSPVPGGECSRPGGQTTQLLALPSSSSAGSQITHGLSAGPPSAPSLLCPWHVLSLALFLEKCTVEPPADKTHPPNGQSRWWFWTLSAPGPLYALRPGKARETLCLCGLEPPALNER